MSLFGTTDKTKDIHTAAPTPAREQKSQRIAILTDSKVEDVEFFYPYYRFNECGYQVDVITEKGGSFEGKHGLGLTDSKAIDSVRPQDYALLYLPGGAAPASLRKSEPVLDFVRQFAATGKPIAAICHGPQLLVSAGLVRGKTLTSFPEVASEIQDAGGTWTDEALQIDGQFITARVPGDLPRHLRGTLDVLAGKHEGSQQTKTAA